ncbi:MAG: dienelactone hydrolase family protein [Candidatus Obscuribacterales bacterium]|nr:dienelactone hydrolase family protein [Candidatus Obscuribacterales bacterium]
MLQDSQSIAIDLGAAGSLIGDLTMLANPAGLVLFAHGSGSSRFSPRNQFVASRLNKSSLAALLIDLLTDKEEELDQFTRQFRFDIGLLSRRLLIAIDWSQKNSATCSLPIGLFGASTGGASAIIAGAVKQNVVKAVVSRGGRPDLACSHLNLLRAPTLLIVGEADLAVIDLNKVAMEKMRCKSELIVVPGATHLFEEAGALDLVSEYAANWFAKYLQPSVVSANESDGPQD